MTDFELRKVWRAAGGKFHGPNIETGSMPETQLLPFLRAMLETPEPLSAMQLEQVVGKLVKPESIARAVERAHGICS